MNIVAKYKYIRVKYIIITNMIQEENGRTLVRFLNYKSFCSYYCLMVASDKLNSRAIVKK